MNLRTDPQLPNELQGDKLSAWEKQLLIRLQDLFVKHARSINSLQTDVSALQTPSTHTTSYSASLTLDASAYDVYDITLTGNLTLDFSSGIDGKAVIIRLLQDGTGGRTLTLGSGCRLSADILSATLSTGAGKLDYLAFRYKSSAAKYDLVALNRGF